MSAPQRRSRLRPYAWCCRAVFWRRGGPGSGPLVPRVRAFYRPGMRSVGAGRTCASWACCSLRAAGAPPPRPRPFQVAPPAVVAACRLPRCAGAPQHGGPHPPLLHAATTSKPRLQRDPTALRFAWELPTTTAWRPWREAPGRHRPLTWTRLDVPWLAGPRRGRDPRHCRSLPCMPSFPSPGAVQYMAPGSVVSIVGSTAPCRLSQRRRRKLREGMRANWSGAHFRRR